MKDCENSNNWFRILIKSCGFYAVPWPALFCSNSYISVCPLPGKNCCCINDILWNLKTITHSMFVSSLFEQKILQRNLSLCQALGQCGQAKRRQSSEIAKGQKSAGSKKGRAHKHLLEYLKLPTSTPTSWKNVSCVKMSPQPPCGYHTTFLDLLSPPPRHLAQVRKG